MDKTFTANAKKVTLSDAKVGDSVWSIREGWGKVKARLTLYTPYPLSIEFENGTCRAYTLWGLYNITDRNPTLFWDEIQFETPEKPLPQLEVDAKVIVWDQGEPKYKRHFSHFDEEGRLFAFNDGRTGFTSEDSPEAGVTHWGKWEVAK